MSFRNADVLYAAGDDILEKYGTWVWRTLPAEEGRRNFSRSGDAWLFDRNMERYRKAESGVARAAHHVHANDGNWYRGFLLERGVTPQNDDSVDFSSSSAWSIPNVTSETVRSSVFDDLPFGGEARGFVVSGEAGRIEQTAGTLTGSKEAFSVIVEDRGNDSTIRVGLFDASASGWVVYVDYDFATDSVSVGAGSGTAIAETLADVGPNGGRVVRVTAIGAGTSGNSRQWRLYLDRDVTGNETVVHHAQHEEGAFPTSPIPYVGSPQSRPGEQFYVDDGPPPKTMTGYMEYVVGVDGNTNNDLRVVHHGNDTNPRLLARYHDANEDVLDFFFFGVNGNSGSPSVTLAIDPGDHVEIAYAVDLSTGESRVWTRVNGGTPKANRATPASWSSPSSFGANERIVYNESGEVDGTHRGHIKLIRHYVVDSAALDNSPLAANQSSDTLDELAGHTV